jgi:RNase adaptor protein for sRNA GlmZ degradation
MDRAADDGIAHERALLAPLRDMADRLLDTTNMTSNDLGQWLRANYAVEGLSEPVMTVMSFGFPRGCRATPISSSTCASCAIRTGRQSFVRAPGWTSR